MVSASRVPSTPCPSPCPSTSRTCIPSTYHSDGSIDSSQFSAESTTPLPTPTTEKRRPLPQPPHPVETHGADSGLPSSPVLPTHTGDSDSEVGDEGDGDEESRADLPYEDEDEDDWQDAQIRESQLFRAEDEEEWIDPLESILGRPTIQEWQLLKEIEAGNDEWSDDEDWHTSDSQNKLDERKKEAL